MVEHRRGLGCVSPALGWMVTVSLAAATVGVQGWTLESCDEEQQACGVIRTHAVVVKLPRAISLLLLQISASLFSTSKAGFEIAPEKQSQILLAAFPKCCQSDWLPCRAVFHQAVDGSVEEGAARCLLLLQGLCEVLLMASVITL